MNKVGGAYKLFSNRSESLIQVHDKITPAEIRHGEKIQIKLKNNKGNVLQGEEIRVWRLSPMGVEIVETPELKQIKIGDPLNLEIIVGNQLSTVSGIKVIDGYNENGLSMIGIRFANNEQVEWQGQERRINKRWNCSAEFMPTGVAPNPGRFNDFIFFRIVNISASGLRLVTSLRNKLLIPGMMLDATVSFPLVGQTRIGLMIRNLSIQNENGKDVLAIGAEYVEKNKIAREIIGQYVFQFGPNVTINELRSEKLPVVKAGQTIEFRFVRSADEYNEVLQLRKLSYEQAGKLKNGATLESVADIYDTRARIIIGIKRGKIVASARLIFNELDDAMEHDQFVVFPKGFPRKDEICEVTRVCTHPDFRGSQILMDMFNFIGLTVVQSKRKYILGCGTDEILKLYRNIGFTITNISYHHSALNNKKHTIFYADIVKFLLGENINPFYWNIVWGDLYQYLMEMKYTESNPIIAMRIAFYKLLRPLCFFVYRLKRREK